MVRQVGFEPTKAEPPDLQSGADYRIDNYPMVLHLISCESGAAGTQLLACEV